MKRVVFAVLISLAATWLVFVLALLLARPKGMDLREAKRFVPDVVRLLRELAKDQSTSRGVRIRLGLLAVYLALPIDLIPDFIPVLGYADDVIVLSLVLRGLVRRVGADAINSHWQGSQVGLNMVRRLAGLS